ncbi:MAG: ferrochelatase [Acidobacteriota bacterium]
MSRQSKTIAQVDMQQEERLGVVLFNLGGPETLAEVRPFLYNLFCDAEIIKLPWRGLQKPFAWLMAATREKKSQGYYAQIGGGSPLRRITEQQANALAAELQQRGIEARAYVAMRCWHPTTEETLEKIVADKITRLIALPLYPQFSISTTRSSLRHFIKIIDLHGGLRQIRRHYITRWHDHPRYIEALAETIEAARNKLPNSDPHATHLVFSAHSVPLSYLEQGEPYLDHTKRTIDLVMERLGRTRPYTLSFQSKIGPVKWLQPASDEVIRQLGKQGARQVLVVPVSFVSDHIETLYELDILYRKAAQEAGIQNFTRAAALNVNSTFIGALADLVEEQLQLRGCRGKGHQLVGGRQ